MSKLLRKNELVVARYGDRWGVGGPDDVFVLTKTRKEARELADKAEEALRAPHPPSQTGRFRVEPEPRSFRNLPER